MVHREPHLKQYYILHYIYTRHIIVLYTTSHLHLVEKEKTRQHNKYVMYVSMWLWINFLINTQYNISKCVFLIYAFFKAIQPIPSGQSAKTHVTPFADIALAEGNNQLALICAMGRVLEDSWDMGGHGGYNDVVCCMGHKEKNAGTIVAHSKWCCFIVVMEGSDRTYVLLCCSWIPGK
jgi:hypothetical protein